MTRQPPLVGLLAVVALGGAVGASSRWLVSEELPADPGGFPWATFAINVSGSLLLALLPVVAVVRRHPLLPPLLGSGVLGGFTTLSTYSEETRALLAGGHSALAASYLLGTLAACLLAVALADRLSTAEARAEVEAEEGDL
jgi:CrcB protein